MAPPDYDYKPSKQENYVVQSFTNNNLNVSQPYYINFIVLTRFTSCRTSTTPSRPMTSIKPPPSSTTTPLTRTSCRTWLANQIHLRLPSIQWHWRLTPFQIGHWRSPPWANKAQVESQQMVTTAISPKHTKKKKAHTKTPQMSTRLERIIHQWTTHLPITRLMATMRIALNLLQDRWMHHQLTSIRSKESRRLGLMKVTSIISTTETKKMCHIQSHRISTEHINHASWVPSSNQHSTTKHQTRL